MKRSSSLAEQIKMYLTSHQFTLAVQTLKEIIQNDPKHIQAFILLGQTYLEKEMWEEALYNFLRAEIIKPMPEIYLNIGVLFFRKKNYKKANEYYEKAQNMGQPLFEIYWNKGIVLEKMKLLEEATLSYINAYELNPKLEICNRIAPLALQAKLYPEAVRFYQILVQHDENPLFYAELGLSYMKLDQYEDSKRCYLKAKELSRLANKHKKIDELCFEDLIAKYDHIDHKIKEAQCLINEDKAQVQDFYDYGNMLFIKGDYEKSEEIFKKARDKYLFELLCKL
jgi:tetratricopeptide (TPR) repeat protein